GRASRACSGRTSDVCQIAPVSAPLPTPRNLPFQCAASGIQISILMPESLVGVSVAVTLQNANGAETTIVAVPLLAVVVNGAVMSTALVIVPSKSDRPVRLVHAAAATRAVVSHGTIEITRDANSDRANRSSRMISSCVLAPSPRTARIAEEPNKRCPETSREEATLAR